ncbi:MAG: tetratricopeptide repeat protein [Treponema sp.]|nr:tetratricopeptide repeat protein [Treponema sp.]
MKSTVKFLSIFLVSVFLASCVSTSPNKETKEEPAVETQTEIPEVNEQEIQEPMKETVIESPVIPEPEDPPAVKFAKLLREKLSKDDMEGALYLFDSIPKEIAEDRDMIFLHASLLVSAGRYEEANSMALQLKEKYPEDLEVLELLALTSKYLGNSGNYKSLSNEILKLDPNNPSMNIQLGQEYALNKKWKQARNCYKKALVSEPENEDALFGYGLMSFYMTQDTEAKKSFEKILELNPNNSMALCYMGKLEAESENYKKAVSYIERAIQNDDKNYDFFMDYGKYLQAQGKVTSAMVQWEKARDLDPNYFLAYAFLAGINDEQNNYEVALENYRKVIETNPAYYYAYESAAILEWREGNWQEARKDFIKAFEVNGKQDWSYALMIAATYLKEGITENGVSSNAQFKAKEFLAPFLKKMPDKESLEYQMVKFWNDNYSKTAANNLILKMPKEESSTKRGKLLFYFGLYNDIYGAASSAAEYYSKVTSMQAPMFYEYRMAEWGLGL